MEKFLTFALLVLAAALLVHKMLTFKEPANDE